MAKSSPITFIWDAVNEVPKVDFKSNLSKFHTDVEMTSDLKVNTLSGDVLTQLDIQNFNLIILYQAITAKHKLMDLLIHYKQTQQI